MDYFNKLVDDPDKFSQLTDRIKDYVTVMVSLVLIGWLPGKMTLEPNLEQLKRGAEQLQKMRELIISARKDCFLTAEADGMSRNDSAQRCQKC